MTAILNLTLQLLHNDERKKQINISINIDQKKKAVEEAKKVIPQY